MKGGQRDHACLGLGGFSFLPDPWEDVEESLKVHTADILKNPDTQKELFSVYFRNHPEGENLGKNLDLALQHLIKTRLTELKDLLLNKDRYGRDY